MCSVINAVSTTCVTNWSRVMALGLLLSLVSELDDTKTIGIFMVIDAPMIEGEILLILHMELVL